MLGRYYQDKFDSDICAQWAAGATDVIGVMPTGAGKTFTFSRILKRQQAPSIAIAHRQELVSQMSLTLAEFGVRHRIIGPKNLIKWVVQEQILQFGNSFYDPSAQVATAGVATLLRRDLGDWAHRVGLWVIDEAHHVLRENQWGKAVDLFPNAYGLGVTATPLRADGKGLGRAYDGVFDAMVEGPTMRALIDEGYLCDYDIYVPPNDLDTAILKIGAAGDYTQDSMKQAVRKSHIVGDVVDHYLRIAQGKLGVTFATDVETAGDISVKYNQAGVKAEVVSAKTPDRLRVELIRRFRNRELHQLVNVDLFGEGFDLPAIEVVSMARPTESYGLFVQQFGRALRTLEGKTKGIIIDHVGNVIRHGLPDALREWSLEGREKGSRKKNDAPSLTTCVACFRPYLAYLRSCVHCGHVPVPSLRSKPEHVQGDLTLLDPATLQAMRGEIAKVNRTAEEIFDLSKRMGLSTEACHKRAIDHSKKQQAQEVLRSMIALWQGYNRAAGLTDPEGYTKFFLDFGVDVATAQTLNKRDAEKLAARVSEALEKAHAREFA